ncbi:MAG: tautomerase family protein [Solirubrobacteraceae bacterium]
MSGGLPDVVGGFVADDAAHKNSSVKEEGVPLIQVKVVAGVFTAQQKQDIIERLTDAMVAIEGESMRPSTWCVVEEIPSGAWGIGGQPITADDERALASG